MASTVWRGFVTFGLISIPVRLFRAARAERVGLKRLQRTAPAAAEPPPEVEEEPVAVTRTMSAKESLPAAVEPAPILSPLKQVSVRSGTEEVVAEQSVVKGYEYEKNRYVALEPEELKSIVPKTTTEMQIEEFVNLAEVDPVYFETSYYVVPEEAGQKAYALLYRSLQISGLVAVAQLAMHGREHVVILRPGGKGMLAHTMFYNSEVRADEEYRTDVQSVSKKELDLAQTLIHSLAGGFQPEKYRDGYREKLESLIASRVAGQPAATIEKPARPSTVIDITDALQRSLAAIKKPAASEAAPATAPKKKARTAR